MDSVQQFASEQLSRGRNTREIITLGLRKKFKPSAIMAAIQRETAMKSMSKAEVLMDEEDPLSSDEEIDNATVPMDEVDQDETDQIHDSKAISIENIGIRDGGGDEDDDWGEGEDDDWGDDGGDWPGEGVSSDHMLTKQEMSPPELTRSSSFKVHESANIRSKMVGLVTRVSDLLYVSRDEAGCLLRHYRWDDKKLEQDWFQDQKKVRSNVGLMSKTVQHASSSDGMVQCLNWSCGRVPLKKAHALSCGHFFCKRCWRNFLESEVSKGRTCLFARCPAMRCKKQHVHKFGCACQQLVPSSVFDKYLNKRPDLLKKYNEWNLQSFVEGQTGLVWCPNPSCNHIVEYKHGGEKTIECQCGQRFCFTCLRPEHEPAPCDLVKKWINSTAVKDDATELWLKARTKTCPKCNVRIEKNKACNHMNCTKCGHHFCWLCKGPWSKHGTSTGGYYVCKKYNEDVKKGERSNEEKDMISTQQMLQKYTYYVGRFNDAKNGVELTQKLEKKLEHYYSRQNRSVEQTKFISDACTSLRFARTCMQWCYVLDFYLMAGKEKKLFEFQQGMLIQQTESLQEIVEERSIEELLSRKKEVLSKTISLNNLRKRMIEIVKEGNFEAVLSYKTDSKSDNWRCLFCETSNLQSNVFCKSCQACKLHGEPDCRACSARK